MHKKILGICVALVALGALALPAIASASPALTQNGSLLATGGTITATQDEAIKFTVVKGGEAVVCNESTLSGKLTTNTGTSIAGDITTAKFTGTSGGQCTSGFLGNITVDVTANWCISANSEVGADKFRIAPNACGSAGGEFTFTLTGALGTCRYKRTTAITGSFTTGGTQATLKTEGEPEFVKEEVSSGICPSAGWLDAKYVLENGTTPLTIS